MLQRNQCTAGCTHLNGIFHVVIRHQVEIIHLVNFSGFGILVIHPGTSYRCIQCTGQIFDCIGCLFLAALCSIICILVDVSIGVRVNGSEDCRKLVLGGLLRIAIGRFSKGGRRI